MYDLAILVDREIPFCRRFTMLRYSLCISKRWYRVISLICMKNVEKETRRRRIHEKYKKTKNTTTKQNWATIAINKSADQQHQAEGERERLTISFWWYSCWWMRSCGITDIPDNKPVSSAAAALAPPFYKMRKIESPSRCFCQGRWWYRSTCCNWFFVLFFSSSFLHTRKERTKERKDTLQTLFGLAQTSHPFRSLNFWEIITKKGGWNERSILSRRRRRVWTDYVQIGKPICILYCVCREIETLLDGRIYTMYKSRWTKVEYIIGQG